MNIAELAQRLSVRTGLTQAESRNVMGHVVEIFRESLLEKQPIRVKGFGSFQLRQRSERTAHNPRTGEPLKIPARKAVVFVPSQTLKQEINV
jgi:hypothetical protein